MSQESEQLLAEILLSQKSLMAEVRALRAQLEGHPGIPEGWMRSGDAAIALKGEGVLNAGHLLKLVSAGVFDTAKGEIRNVSKGDSLARWEFHAPKCRKALQRHFKRLQSGQG